MPVRTIREFIKLEASAGIILFSMAVLAMILDNSPFHEHYDALLNTKLVINFGDFVLSKPLILWVNDGLMTIFFLLVGLEIKREMLEGELNSLSKIALPGIGAIGSMVVPALIYLYFNHDHSMHFNGWAVPTATDIAFSLGILALLGSRVPVSLKSIFNGTCYHG